MQLTSERAIDIEPGLKRMILIELVFPMIISALRDLPRAYASALSLGNYAEKGISRPRIFPGLTLHGVVNAIVFTTFFAVAFGYVVIRFYLGRPLNMKMAWLSFALMIVGTLLAAAAILSGRQPFYTFYPPLRAPSRILCRPRAGRDWFVDCLPRLVRPTLPGNVSILAKRCRSRSVGIFATFFIVWVVATIPVAIEMIFMLIPWSMGWVPTVNVPLAGMLFGSSAIRSSTSGFCRLTSCPIRCCQSLRAGSCIPTLPADLLFSGWCFIRRQSGFITSSPTRNQ